MMSDKRPATAIRERMIRYDSSCFRRIVFSGINVGYFEVYDSDLVSGFLEALKLAEYGTWPSRSLFDSIRFDFVDANQESIEIDFTPQRFGDAFFLMLKCLETKQAEHLRHLIRGCHDKVQTIRVENESVVLLPKDTDEVLSCLSEADERFCAYTVTAPGFGVVIYLNLLGGETIESQLIFPHPRIVDYKSLLPTAFWEKMPKLYTCIQKYEQDETQAGKRTLNVE